jgi:hypothetical protein
MSEMDGCAARVAARESGDERVQSLTISETFRDVSTLLDMTIQQRRYTASRLFLLDIIVYLFLENLERQGTIL